MLFNMAMKLVLNVISIVGAKEVWEYFDEECIDTEGADEQEILEADEVFAIPDGRFLIVEA